MPSVIGILHTSRLEEVGQAALRTAESGGSSARHGICGVFVGRIKAEFLEDANHAAIQWRRQAMKNTARGIN